MRRLHWLGCFIALSSVGCSPSADVAFDEAVDFTGAYSVAVTNGKNGCGFSDWVEGDSNANISLTVVQKGNEVTATVDGIPGALLGLLHGTNMYAGTVKGRALTMWIDGTIAASQGNCTFTWSNDASATLEGDFIQGKIVYSRAHNGNPDCVPLTCETVQQFNGTRPPP
jgi:hypothetical protein